MYGHNYNQDAAEIAYAVYAPSSSLLSNASQVIAMAHIAMPCIVMAYIVMAFVVVADVIMAIVLVAQQRFPGVCGGLALGPETLRAYAHAHAHDWAMRRCGRAPVCTYKCT